MIKDGIRDMIAGELKRAYKQVVAEPLPEDMRRLLERLG